MLKFLIYSTYFLISILLFSAVIRCVLYVPTVAVSAGTLSLFIKRFWLIDWLTEWKALMMPDFVSRRHIQDLPERTHPSEMVHSSAGKRFFQAFPLACWSSSSASWCGRMTAQGVLQLYEAWNALYWSRWACWVGHGESEHPAALPPTDAPLQFDRPACLQNQYVPTESVCAKRISMCQQNQYVPTESVKCLQNQYVEASFETAITTPFKYLSKEVCFKGAWKCAAQ